MINVWILELNFAPFEATELIYLKVCENFIAYWGIVKINHLVRL